MFLQIYKILSNFDSNTLICALTLFPGQKSPNIGKGNCVFSGKGGGDRALILTYLISPMAEVFPHYCLSFFDFGHLQGETSFIRLFFLKTRILQFFLNNVFICQSSTSGENFGNIVPCFGE